MNIQDSLAMLWKSLKSRTIWLGILVTVLGTVQAVVLNVPMDPMVQAAISGVLGIVIVLLRLDTNGSVSDK